MAGYDPNQPRDDAGRWTSGDYVKVSAKGMKHSGKSGFIIDKSPSGKYWSVNSDPEGQGRDMGYYHESDLENRSAKERVRNAANAAWKAAHIPQPTPEGNLPSNWNEMDLQAKKDTIVDLMIEAAIGSALDSGDYSEEKSAEPDVYEEYIDYELYSAVQEMGEKDDWSWIIQRLDYGGYW